MVASTDIKFYVHTNNNAPQLQNAYGSMINVLDACLINGIQIGVVNSLTAVGNTVTATFGAAHNLMQYQVIKITGANQPEFNGEHRILSIPDTSSFTFELAAAPSVSTVTGTISASLPPLGWEKPFSNSNPSGGGRAAYRSLNLLLPSRPFLRVVDELDPAYTATYAKYAKVGIVEDMTDIDTMLGVQAPFDNAAPNKNWVGTGSGASAINGWAKWYYAGISNPNNNTNDNLNNGYFSDSSSPENGNRKYLIIGNSEIFYLFSQIGINSAGFTVYGFGAFDDNFNLSRHFLASHLFYRAANWTDVSGQGRAGANGLTTSEYTGLILINRPLDLSATHTTASLKQLTDYPGRDAFVNKLDILGQVQYSDCNLFSQSCFIGTLPLYKWAFQQKQFSNFNTFLDENDIYMALTLNLRRPPYGGLGEAIIKIGSL
ncbi:hypothetical protein [Acinetobacter towneri]|uniref:hypothetical protein n=1 Tax=Acinetobacter towneri TaxID=202956 RepID=UPI001CE13D85|nr:hypothetical protein [Acinetobacter towneri]MCA4788992.1 hypothetical protein [Acinetobacter towneri]